MLLRKEKGGSGIKHRGVLYEWPEDGAVTEVPNDFGTTLLAIADGGYTVAVPEDKPARPPAEVTEPAPKTAAEVTEPTPAPEPAEVTEPASKPAAGARRGRAPATEKRE